jgi:hypothetical protein
MIPSGGQAPYIRLTPKKRAWTGASQAWLGSDHLLLVHSSRYVERYQRFAFSDIQAIVVTQTGRRAVWQSIVTVVCFSLALSSQLTILREFWGIAGSFAVFLALIDVARGPRCRCFLQTAVSRERLRCVSRMPTARSFLAAVAPAVEAVQGTLPSEQFTQAPWADPSPVAASATMAQPPALHRTLRYGPEALFGILLLDSILVFMALRATVGAAFGLLPLVYFAEFVLGILALTQARERNATLLIVLVATFVCVLIDPFALSGLAVWPGFVAGLREASAGMPAWALPIAAPARTMLLSIGWRAMMAIVGLLVCYFERTAARS